MVKEPRQLSKILNDRGANKAQDQIPSPQSPFKYGNLKCIGRGNFGDVYKASDLTSKSKQLVAIKVTNLDDSSDDIQQIINEIQFLSKLRHVNIIRYIESFAQNYNMFIVMDYCGGGSCSDLLKYHKKLKDHIVSYIIKGVLQGLSYLHGQQTVHRDVKAANILLTENGIIKLADFGVSTELTMTKRKKHTFVGTPFWMAPEVITRGASYGRVKKNEGYDYKADIWSMGITTIELINGAPPLAEHDPLKILFEIPKKKPPILKGSQYSENIKDFVKYCLIMEADKRPSCSTLLRHYFITKQTHPDVQAELVELIASKNAYFNTKVYSKPRRKLNCDEIDSVKDTSEKSAAYPSSVYPIEWEFTPTMGKQRCESGDISPISESLETDEGGGNKENRELNHKTINNIPNSEMGKRTPLELIDLHAVVKTDNKSTILFHCLEKVLRRGRDNETKKGVENLIDMIYDCEQKHPGLCHALVEEIERAICR
ncbi:hypothetical protein KGF56_003315 [Candida oxycetoniae]|uniref:non-specific serine/threonine protein kinase n=1 Tax=Candida oxycetoniae TaxID=497107 RepID=A0AAI9SWL9_9ASCO|nr:uncharacterized protein KGF56_003315 [Candida oxycetoniae]KAI3403885.2 hypothetical protein KGF56_003315 [Candida oxycetoniae]